MDRLAGRLVALAIVTLFTGLTSFCGVAYAGSSKYAMNYGVELSELERQAPVTAGLAWGYYLKACPSAESIVTARVAASIQSDGGVAAGLLRLFFHDCFVQGCDASILLKLSSGTELDDIPNQTIRASALQLVDDIKTRLESACPRTVSCADIVVLSAKVAVQQAGGPTFNVPLGRRDSLSFSQSTSDLPSPTTTFAQQSSIFGKKGLSTTDLVALAGAHTLGVAHCASFNFRILPTVQPKMNSGYAGYLKANVCPTLSNTNSTGLDFYSPNKFDNQYFKNLPTGGALLESDQNLDQDSTAWSLVNNWGNNQGNFFNQFPQSFIKMSQIQTLTGSNGEIRKLCSKTNSGSITDSSVPESVELVQSVDSSSESKSEHIAMVVDGRADS